MRSQDAADNAYSNWTNTAPDEALAWATALPPGKVRDQLTIQSISNLAATDPQRTVTLFETNTSVEAQPNAASNLLSVWARDDPTAAATWASKLSGENFLQSGLGSIAHSWAEQDPVAAAHWLEREPAGKARDSAECAFASQAASSDPEGALAWVATIGDDSLRRNQAENLARNWLREDPDAARQWITSTNQIPAERKAQLLRPN